MKKRLFNVLLETLEQRVQREGKKDAAWLLGFVEGLGDRKLTGYQVGALIDLLLLDSSVPSAEDEDS